MFDFRSDKSLIPTLPFRSFLRSEIEFRPCFPARHIIFSNFQYLFNKSMNYFDIAVDENALWILYHLQYQPFLSVSKLDIGNLTIYESWNLTMINHTEVSNGFVVCGVLYLVKSAKELKSEITIAFDFYRTRYRKPNIKWVNLYRNANMMSYNPFDKRIYVYDHGYLLTMPARISWRAR